MKVKRIDHIGIAVPNLQETVQVYKKLLGKEPEHFEEVAEQKVRTAFFSVGDTDLEFLESTTPDGPIGRFLLKQGRGGVHHICLQVQDIDAALRECRENGFQLIDESPRIGAHGKKIAFVHPKSTGGVLIELAEIR